MLKVITFGLIFTLILLSSAKITLDQLLSINSALKTVVELSNQCSTSTDCTTAPVGARACGGPGGYIGYSKKNPYVRYILSLANLTRVLGREYNSENFIVSTCDLERPRGAYCSRNKTCI